MKMSRNIIQPILMTALPIAAALLYFILKDDLPGECKMKTLERWRDGEAKTLSCDWAVNGVSYMRLCARRPDGQEVGCWTTRNDEPYEGDVVEWYAYERMPDPRESYGVPRAVMHFSRGQADGLWLNYYPNGKLMNETVFENGKSIEVKLFDQSGKLVRSNRF